MKQEVGAQRLTTCSVVPAFLLLLSLSGPGCLRLAEDGGRQPAWAPDLAGPPSDLGSNEADLAADAGPAAPDLAPDGEIRPTCTDLLEPNDSVDQARPLQTGTWEDLFICPNDHDFFRFELDAGEPFDIRALFTHATGDLDLLWTDTVTGRMIRFETSGDHEEASGVARSAGTHLLEVYGFQGQTNRYSLVVRLGQECLEDPREPNDHPAEAVALAEGEHLGRLCPGNEDWFTVAAEPGEHVLIMLSFAPGEGRLELELAELDDLGAPQPPLPDVVAADGRRTRLLGPVAAATRYSLRIWATGQETAAYTLLVHRFASATVQPVQVLGQVTRDDFLLDETGFGPPLAAPAPHVEVELIREADGLALAAGQTDADGHFELLAELIPGLPHAVRALARSEQGGAVVEVRTRRRLGPLQAFRGELFTPQSAVASLRADLHIPAAGAGGAFNIAAVLHDGLGRLAPWIPLGSAPRLTVRWEPGVTFPCGSCFYGNQLDVGGGAEDPDEFDDAVILHELGHFVAETWSRDDSAGGDHEGERTDPRLAWSEGWATFHAAWQQAAPLYLDYRLTDVMAIDLERQAEAAALGTSDGTMQGAVSEHLVSALLWDLFDAPVPDDDPLAGDERLLIPVFGYLAGPALVDRGVAGVDLQDYLDGYLCHGLGPAEPLVRLAEQRRYPYDPEAAPTNCTWEPPAMADLPGPDGSPAGKPRAPLEVLLVPDPTATPITPSAAGEAGWLLIRSRVDTPRAVVQVAGQPPRELGPLRLNELRRIAVRAPGGLPLLVGVTIWPAPGQRLHAVARRDVLAPPAPWIRPGRPGVDLAERLHQPDLSRPSWRTTLDRHGEPLHEWQR